MSVFRTYTYPTTRKPKVFKRDGMWWVQRPSYHCQRYRRWQDAIDSAIEWWF